MKQVLVIQLARMGDLLQSKRLIASLQAEGNTQVHLLVDESLQSFACWVYPQCIVHSILASMPSLQSLSDVFHDPVITGRLLDTYRTQLNPLKEISFSTVYLLNSSPLSLILARLFKAEQCQGFWVDKGQPGRSHWVRLTERFTEHRGTSPLNLIDYWAYFHPHPIAPSMVNPLPQKAGENRIGVVLSGQQPRRSLPPSVLALCMEALFEGRKGPSFILLGTEAEQRNARAVLRLLPAPIAQRTKDLTGKTRLLDLPDIFAGLDMLITPDTGLMHLGAHCGVPVQAFFLSSAWCFETGPYGLGHTVWQAVEPCSPCLEIAPCPHEVQCLSPFRSTPFLQYLRGKFDENWPSNLCGFVSRFDALGGTYTLVDGVDRYAKLRAQKRALAQEFLYTSMIPTALMSTTGREVGEAVYRERDWLLPERRERG